MQRPQTVAGSLRELTWNHTTLHARAADPAWTYLQLLLPPEPTAALQALGRQQGEDPAWHPEAVMETAQAKQAYDPAGLLNPGKLRGWLERGAPA